MFAYRCYHFISKYSTLSQFFQEMLAQLGLQMHHVD